MRQFKLLGQYQWFPTQERLQSLFNKNTMLMLQEHCRCIEPFYKIQNPNAEYVFIVVSFFDYYANSAETINGGEGLG